MFLHSKPDWTTPSSIFCGSLVIPTSHTCNQPVTTQHICSNAARFTLRLFIEFFVLLRFLNGNFFLSCIYFANFCLPWNLKMTVKRLSQTMCCELVHWNMATETENKVWQWASGADSAAACHMINHCVFFLSLKPAHMPPVCTRFYSHLFIWNCKKKNSLLNTTCLNQQQCKNAAVSILVCPKLLQMHKKRWPYSRHFLGHVRDCPLILNDNKRKQLTLLKT